MGPLENHPKFYFLPKTNFRAFRAGHLDVAIVENIPAARLVFDQIMRLDNLNPAGAGGSIFRIALNDGGYVHELKHQVVGGSERSQGSIEMITAMISAMARGKQVYLLPYDNKRLMNNANWIALAGMRRSQPF